MSMRKLSRKFHRTDDILKGFTFGFLMVQLQKRGARLSHDKVRDLFMEHLHRQVIEAKQVFEDHFDDLMENLEEKQEKAGLLQ